MSNIDPQLRERFEKRYDIALLNPERRDYNKDEANAFLLCQKIAARFLLAELEKHTYDFGEDVDYLLWEKVEDVFSQFIALAEEKQG